MYLWARAGGACALCGTDLAQDVRTLKRVAWGELAHIIGARPDAARGDVVASPELAKDPDNIVLLCPSCHTKVDKDETAYSVELLRRAKQWHEERVRAAARYPASAQALPIALTSKIRDTPNEITDNLIAEAMLQVGLVRGRDDVFRIDLGDPAEHGGRTNEYWATQMRRLRFVLEGQLDGRSADQGPLSAIALFGRADMSSLIAAGTLVGNRCALHVFQPRRRDGRWLWADLAAKAPAFKWNATTPLEGDGPLVLVFSLSVRVPIADVLAVFPDDPRPRVVEFTVDEPGHELVQGPLVGPAFHDAARACVSELESHLRADRSVHVIPVMPASLAVHFGAAITLNYMPTYHIYERNGDQAFELAMQLPLP
ncbi:MAG: SAVED domain-containing protein [Rudaea sp.]|uniref:HNH endonuclease n=1 Tax=Rudaea sp. TaxID=2136325 RepID=UPI0039E4A4C9